MPSFMRRLFLLVASVAVPVVLFACATDDDGPPGPKSIGGGVDSSATPTNDAGVDAAPEAAADAPIDQATVLPVRCSQAEFDAADNTGAAGPFAVTFPVAPGPAQYTNNCIKVKVGAVVNFTGSFLNHPLEPNGGNSPTPIPASTAVDPPGGTLAVTMTTAGTFGYQCNFHPGTMFGAIQVVP
jgi:plastocyanin